MNKLRDKELLLAFGTHLRILRERKKLTLEAFALEADIEISQVYRIEKGKINPTLSTLNTLASALELDLSTLMNFSK